MTDILTDTFRQTIRVDLGARSYPILIQANLLKTLGDELQQLGCSGKVGMRESLEGTLR